VRICDQSDYLTFVTSLTVTFIIRVTEWLYEILIYAQSQSSLHILPNNPAHTPTHSLTYSPTLTHTPIHSLTLTLTHTYTHTHVHSHSLTLTLTHTHSLTLTLTHTHTHSHSHSRTGALIHPQVALMYNSPRNATIIASSASTVWAVDRFQYRAILGV
jgi:hypothetical protein